MTPEKELRDAQMLQHSLEQSITHLERKGKDTAELKKNLRITKKDVTAGKAAVKIAIKTRALEEKIRVKALVATAKINAKKTKKHEPKRKVI